MGGILALQLLVGAPLSGLGISPDVAILLGTVGFCLISLELNRPGMIVPGAGGLLLVLLSIYGFHDVSVRPWALAGLLLAGAVLFANLWLEVPRLLLILATLGLVGSLRWLAAPPSPAVHVLTACVCGLSIGGLGAILSRIALRARRAKQVN